MDAITRITIFAESVILIAILILIGSLPMTILRIRLARHPEKFKCIQCGTCCRISKVPLEEKDIKRIEEKGIKDFWEIRGGEKVLKRERGKCIFLKDEVCGIHEFKPKMCGEFPFFKVYGISYCRLWMSCPAIEQLVKDVKSKKKTD